MVWPPNAGSDSCPPLPLTAAPRGTSLDGGQERLGRPSLIAFADSLCYNVRRENVHVLGLALA